MSVAFLVRSAWCEVRKFWSFFWVNIKIKTSIIDKVTSAAIRGTCIARDLINEPLSHLNAEQLSRVLKKFK